MNQPKNRWRSGTVIDCLDDVDACIITVCLPCLVFSENRSLLHGGAGNTSHEGINPCIVYCFIMSLSACTLQCLYAYSTRTDIRRKYNLEEEPCDDCLTHICCHLCALCQEHRELKMYPVTPWPLPASQDPNSQYHRHDPNVPSMGYLASNPYTTPPSSTFGHSHQQPAQRHPYSQSGSSVPIRYAHSVDSTQSYGYHMPPQYGLPGGYYPMHPFPATPPPSGPPQPLVFETHRVNGSHGTGVIPGIPAHVFQVPRFPDMNRNADSQSNPSNSNPNNPANPNPNNTS